VTLGGFMELLTWGARVREGDTLLPDGVEARFETSSALNVPDPTDSSRNVAAAVAPRTLARFSRACRDFILTPDRRYFFPAQPRPLPRRTLWGRVERWGDAVGVLVPVQGRNRDELISQARKSLRSMKEHLLREGYQEVRGEVFLINQHHNSCALNAEALFVLVVSPRTLPETVVHQGPPTNTHHAARFRKKWEGHRLTVRGPYTKNGRLEVVCRRERRNARDVLTAALSSRKVAHGKAVRTGLEKARVLGGDELVRTYPLELTQVVEGKDPAKRMQFPFPTPRRPR